MKLYTITPIVRYVDEWSPWGTWFAWHPVVMSNEVRWLETVERRYRDTPPLGWDNTWERSYQYRLRVQG